MGSSHFPIPAKLGLTLWSRFIVSGQVSAGDFSGQGLDGRLELSQQGGEYNQASDILQL